MCACMWGVHCLILYECGCACTQVPLHVEAPRLTSGLILIPLNSVRRDFSVKPSTHIWLVLLASLHWGSSLSLLRVELQMSHHCSITWVWSLNSGLHAYISS